MQQLNRCFFLAILSYFYQIDLCEIYRRKAPTYEAETLQSKDFHTLQAPPPIGRRSTQHIHTIYHYSRCASESSSDTFFFTTFPRPTIPFPASFFFTTSTFEDHLTKKQQKQIFVK